ncbi:MAG: efflux RND transporter permease subunit [Desulfobacterales bacterium]|nr:efflux RND transporter permease subunit [Desulfobacterales bacterium]
MLLSDLSVKRPVFATVISLLLVVFGLVAFTRLPLREYPNIDPPIVSIETNYTGAAANVVETRITELIEDSIAGVEGIETIGSSSVDGRSRITVEFNINRDVDGAANDIRDRISAISDDLPDEADPPEIQKVDADADVIMWLNLVSDQMSVMELTDYARRYIEDRFSTLEGVARVRIGGGLDTAMRIWLDPDRLAARDLTITEVEDTLRGENVELPAGNVESAARDFTVRVLRGYRTVQDFEQLVLRRGDDGYLVRLKDVGRVQIGPVESRNLFRGNGKAMVGIGIIKQSKANTLAVAQRAKAQARIINASLPQGMRLIQSYDTSVFIQSAIKEVYQTLFIAIGLVTLVIYLFLGSARATIVPSVTVPVSLIATFILLWAFGFSVNLLTLLALVLAIGLVVDDAIVVLENIYRRIELGETALVAAYRGVREVSFAVIATTLALIAVFVPIAFLEGDVGRLFSEFALTMAVAVAFSSLVALSMSPMLASKLLRSGGARRGRVDRAVNKLFDRLQQLYLSSLESVLKHPVWTVGLLVVILGANVFLYRQVPSEFAPKEDRGAFFVIVNGPEGASYDYMRAYMDEIETRLMPFVDSGEFERLLIRAPRAFGRTEVFNTGFVIMVLSHWDEGRRSAWELMRAVQGRIADLTGVRAFPVMRQGLGGGIRKPVQFVIGGSNYADLVRWRDTLIAKAGQNKGLSGLDHDYKETKPQLKVVIDRDRAGDLGVSVANISRSLESKLGSRQVTTFIDDGEQYDVIVEGEDDMFRSPTDLTNIYVRSQRSGQLIPLSNLVTVEDFADSAARNRYNRIRSITIEANLTDGYSLGQALAYLEELVRTELPPEVIIDYKGQSLEYKDSTGSLLFVFLLALVVVYLVLAAQFESFIHPLVIMLTVPLAVAGALMGLMLTGQTLNIYSQIGLIMLIGLAAKNGILIVEFINQLRDAGLAFDDAIREAAAKRLRPILMTAITTAIGAIPLIAFGGAGSETRLVIGVVVLFGVIVATGLTLYIIPVAYQLIARASATPLATTRKLARQLDQHPRPAAAESFTTANLSENAHEP